MRILTQVWFFFTTLTFLFLLLGFQLAGRPGLFIALLVSLFFIYAALQRGLKLFKKKLKAKEFAWHDPSGFISEIQNHKLKFGFNKITIYQTEHSTPPLIWKSNANEGHIVINFKLLENLQFSEIQLLTLFLLSHLENRSFLVTPILSVINQSFFSLNIFSILLSTIVTLVFDIKRDIIKSDKKFKNISTVSNYELGYFINKLHKFDFNQTKKKIGTEYFSVLSFQNYILPNQYGIPNLKLRLENIMGFVI